MAILNSLLISLYRGGALYRHQNDYLKNTRIILSKLILHFILGYVLTVVSTELLILNHGTTFNSGVRYSYLSYPFFGVSVICLAMCIFCLSANCESAINLGSIYAGPAMAFMGVTFPILSMPAIGQFLSHIYPSRLYIDHIIQSNSTPFDLTIFFNNIIGYGSFLGLGVVIYIIKTMSNNRE
ncbi:ABC transporter permease [Photobacterium leiognathi]|nr:ABC transporter permease [Photobacterium leiognathi]